MSKDEALKMAGYDLDGVIADVEKFDGFDNVCLETIKRVRNVIAETLEQPAQGIELEWYNKGWTDANWEWQGLTDDEVREIRERYRGDDWLEGFWKFYHDVEQALKEKNHG
jgi:hypothetical protein